MQSVHPSEILSRVERRLKDVLNLSDAACFVSEDPRNVYPPSMPDKAYIITSEGSSFNSDGDQTSEYIVESRYFDVTCFNRLASIDDNSRAHSLVTRNDVNLFEMERRVLRTLVNWRLNIPGLPELEIASTVKATRCGKPEFLSTADGAVHAAFLPITFSVSVPLDLCNEDYNV